jgi:hypothetical protein
MIDEKALKEYVKDRCYEIVGLRSVFTDNKERLKSVACALIESDYFVSSVDLNAKSVEHAYIRYTDARNTIKLLCCTLGGEYYDIYKRIVGED